MYNYIYLLLQGDCNSIYTDIVLDTKPVIVNNDELEGEHGILCRQEDYSVHHGDCTL